MVAMISPGATTLPSGRSARSVMAGDGELEGAARDVESGHDAGLPRAQHQRGLLVGGNDRVRRDVAGAAEVLEQGGSHDRFVHDGQQGIERHDWALPKDKVSDSAISRAASSASGSEIDDGVADGSVSG